MINSNKQIDNSAASLHLAIKLRSDRLMDYFLLAYFLVGIILAAFYNTWLIAFGVGGLALLAYYSAKILLPESTIYQYVLSAVFGVFMAQFIYQMHGLFEMHFFAFIGSAILITYQKWKLQIPVLILVFLHHACFSYIQNTGVKEVYFTQLDYFDLQTFIIHMLLTAVIFFICGLWAYQLKKFTQQHILQALQMADLQKEAELSHERQQHAEILAEINTHLQAQARELAFSNAELEQFAYVASHDLQEPLRTIAFSLKLLNEKYSGQLGGKGLECLNLAVDGAKRMKQLILDLLEFSKVGKKEEQYEQVNLEHLLKDQMALYQQQIAEKHAQIIFGQLPVIHTNKTAIRQVLQNLITNGLKYQQPGNVPLINITCDDIDTHWQFMVADNGIGINATHYDDIFTIFRRLNARDEYPGTGVGLAITKKIVEYLGGTIWVESVEGKGSTFHFTILKNQTHTL